jgi:acyl dehydratase
MTQKEEIRLEVVSRLTRERVEEHRKRVGMKFNTTGSQRGLNQVAHWDNISVFVENVGDPNPLWRDEEHAGSTRYGTPPAPPAFLLSVWPGAVMHGLPGVQAMFGGAAYEFYKPVLDGDKITVECTFADLAEKSSAFSPLWLIEYYDSLYYNQRGELLAKVRSHMLRWERSEIDGGLKRTDKAKQATLPHHWTEEEIRQIEDEVLAEVDNIRGATARYWEDVSEGETLPDLVRGPRRIFDAVAEGVAMTRWLCGPVLLAELQRHPGRSVLHPESKAHEDLMVVGFDMIAAQQLGFPHSPDIGLVRQYLGMEAVIDWMGDDGWLKRFSSQLRRPVYISDVIRIKGKVTRKYIDEDGEHCVDIKQNTMNQRGDDVMPGQVTVALPSREKGTWPVSKRVPAKG